MYMCDLFLLFFSFFDVTSLSSHRSFRFFVAALNSKYIAILQYNMENVIILAK